MGEKEIIVGIDATYFIDAINEFMKGINSIFVLFLIVKAEQDRFAHWSRYPQKGRRAKRMKQYYA